MKVILLQDIASLGRKNEVKEVSPGYARNFLLVKKLAVPATDAAIRALAVKKAQEERGKSEEDRKARAALDALNHTVLKFKMKTGGKGRAFGSVNAAKIQQELERNGIEIHKEWIMLDEPIKSTGEKTVDIQFPHGIKGEIKIVIEPE